MWLGLRKEGWVDLVCAFLSEKYGLASSLLWDLREREIIRVFFFRLVLDMMWREGWLNLVMPSWKLCRWTGVSVLDLCVEILEGTSHGGSGLGGKPTGWSVQASFRNRSYSSVSLAISRLRFVVLWFTESPVDVAVAVGVAASLSCMDWQVMFWCDSMIKEVNELNYLIYFIKLIFKDKSVISFKWVWYFKNDRAERNL